MALTKTIKYARPTVDTASGNVITWNVEVTFKEGDFERDYSYSKDVKDLNKKPSAFTQADVLGYAPDVLDEVFAHHKEVFSDGYKAPTETINDFEFSSK